MLTVGELRHYLATTDLDDSMPIVIQKDAGGNSYSPLDGLGPNHYRIHNTWSGHVTTTPRKDDVWALILAPVN